MTNKLLPTVTLKRGVYKNKVQLFLHFKYNNALIALVKGLPGAWWSVSLKCWYVLDNATNLQRILRGFRNTCSCRYASAFSPHAYNTA